MLSNVIMDKRTKRSAKKIAICNISSWVRFVVLNLKLITWNDLVNNMFTELKVSFSSNVVISASKSFFSSSSSFLCPLLLPQSFQYSNPIYSSPHSHLTPLTFPFADAELCDSPPRRGRVQHCLVAQKPREEPQHGCFAARSCSGLPGDHRRGEQQLHQCRSRWQLSPASCFYCDPSPPARNHGGLLEAGFWLRLHSSSHAQPAKSVQLCLGMVKPYIRFYCQWLNNTIQKKAECSLRLEWL